MINERLRSPKRIVADSFNVVAEIVRSNVVIESLTLVTYQESANWRELSQGGDELDLGLLRKGVEQDSKARILTKLPRAEATDDNLGDIAQSLGENRLLGTCSKVCLAGGKSAHIPMMDFMCEISTKNLDLLIRLIEDLHQGRGYLLDSGRSYHYYGSRLLTEDEWRAFLGKCLLMTGFSDNRYIGHQLVDGHCVLRLSSAKLKSKTPTVVAEIS